MKQCDSSNFHKSKNDLKKKKRKKTWRNAEKYKTWEIEEIFELEWVELAKAVSNQYLITLFIVNVQLETRKHETNFHNILSDFHII